MYYDSPPASNCEEGTRCVINKDGDTECIQESMFDEDESLYYRPCSNDSLLGCPYGSFCVRTLGNFFCVPYCNLDTHPGCPKPGKCHYARGPESNFDICFIQDDCKPVDGTGCKQKDMACYFSFDLSNDSLITICTPPGSISAYQQCEMPWDCIPGHVCTGGSGSLGDVKRCIPLCDDSHPCSNSRETCQYIMGTVGVCSLGPEPLSLFLQ